MVIYGNLKNNNMLDRDKSKEQLIKELNELRILVDELRGMKQHETQISVEEFLQVFNKKEKKL